MNLKFAFTLAMALLASVLHGQTNVAGTNLVPVVIHLTPANAALVADFQSNDVPLDSVITLGARATLNQARGRLLDEINHMSFKDLAGAYPQLVPITDTNAPLPVQEQQMRTLVSMQLSKIKTPGDACRLYALIGAAHRDSSTNAAVRVPAGP